MKKLIISSLIGLLIVLGVVIGQIAISFPQSFEITLPQLPARLSEDQLIFNCPYDQNIEYRMVGIRNLIWNGTIPIVTADVKYWTKNKSCAGSKKFQLILPITLTQQQLILNFQNQINTEFINEALSNRQRRRENTQYISGSQGLG